MASRKAYRALATTSTLARGGVAPPSSRHPFTKARRRRRRGSSAAVAPTSPPMHSGSSAAVEHSSGPPGGCAPSWDCPRFSSVRDARPASPSADNLAPAGCSARLMQCLRALCCEPQHCSQVDRRGASPAPSRTRSGSSHAISRFFVLIWLTDAPPVVLSPALLARLPLSRFSRPSTPSPAHNHAFRHSSRACYCLAPP